MALRERDAEVWVERFVSDDVERDVGTVGEELLRAAGRLVERVRAVPRVFGKDDALQAYANDVAIHHFPGLSQNKVRQVNPHFALMHQLLACAL